MFSFLSENVDALAYLHGYLLISMGVIVLLLGRVRAWTLPSKTLALCFLFFGLRVWSRIARFNLELGPEGYGVTLIFTLAAGAMFVEFVRRVKFFSGKPKHWANAAGALWFRSNSNVNTKPVRFFWLAMCVYIMGYFFTPNASVELNSHLAAELRYQYALSFLLQMGLLLPAISILIWLLNKRFREIHIHSQLTLAVGAGLAVWVLGAVGATFAMASVFGNHAKTVSDRNYQDTIANLKSHIENISHEGDVRLNLAASGGLVDRAVEKAKVDKIAASKILDGMCQPKKELVCYILNGSGETIATSNWDSEKSFLGNSLRRFPDFTPRVVSTFLETRSLFLS